MRVNVDSSVVTDPRYALVARDAGMSRREVIGTCFMLWLACYERRSSTLPIAEAEVAVEAEGFLEALAKRNLVTFSDDEDEVFVHGVEKRIGFLKEQSAKGKKGGRSSGKSRKNRKVGREANASGSDEANAEANASDPPEAEREAYSPDPDLDLAAGSRAHAREDSTSTSSNGEEPSLRALGVKLWDVLTKLRGDLGLPYRGRLPGEENRPANFLEQSRWSYEQAEAGLRALADEVREEPDKAEYLDGVRTWSSEVLGRAVSAACTPRPAKSKFASRFTEL